MSQPNAHFVINQGDGCDCLECRVRAALKGDDEDGLIDGNEALNAIGNIFCELLAHLTEEGAAEAIAQLQPAVEGWRKEPIVQNQLTDEIGEPEGHA